MSTISFSQGSICAFIPLLKNFVMPILGENSAIVSFQYASLHNGAVSRKWGQLRNTGCQTTKTKNMSHKRDWTVLEDIQHNTFKHPVVKEINFRYACKNLSGGERERERINFVVERIMDSKDN